MHGLPGLRISGGTALPPSSKFTMMIRPRSGEPFSEATINSYAFFGSGVERPGIEPEEIE
jgi:hypothetical protein